MSVRTFVVLAVSLLLSLVLPSRVVQAQDADSSLPEPLAACIEAHGGLDAWQAQGTLEYDFTRTTSEASLSDHQLVDLRERRVRITSDDYTLVHDGTDVGIAPSAEALPYGPGPRFYSQTYFYFFAIPFVLADPGINYEVLPDETVGGTRYEVVRVSYDEGIGESPDDVYIAYVDAETSELGMVRYSVTFGDINMTEPNSVIVYREWTDDAGLRVPSRATFHDWNGGDLGPEKAEVTYGNVAFDTERPADSTFAMPD